MPADTLLETGDRLTPRFDAHGLLPCVVTDAEGGDVLMVAWMNAEALDRTVETGTAHYWSRSRRELWRKGETSGHVQHVEDIRIDCDQDTIWLIVRQTGAACHVGYRSCFYRRVTPDGLAPVGDAPVFDPNEVYGRPTD